MTGQRDRGTLVELDRIVRDPNSWPRLELDATRIAGFTDLYAAEGSGALPPVEFIPGDDGTYLVADGWHRIEAAIALDWRTVPAVVVSAPVGMAAEQFAYEEALRTASTAALPLTRAERQRAIERMLAESPELSDRHIARRVGVAHTTVSRIRNGRGATHHPDPGEAGLVEQSAAEAAVKLLRSLEKLRESRGLGLRNRLFGDRMGERLAEAIRDAHGDDALERAHAYGDWLEAAVDELRSD